MPRLIIYLFPVLSDMVLSSAFFLVTVRAAGQGASAQQVGGLLAMYAVFYMVACALVTTVVNRRSAAWLMIGSCSCICGVSLAFLIVSGLLGMYVLMGLLGIAFAAFFAPFQVFMKYVDAGGGRSVAASSGLYVCSWSVGFALGPFVTGYLWQRYGWNPCNLLNAGAAALIAVGIYWLKHYAHTEEVTTTSHSADTAPEVDVYARMPDLAWMAWVFGGIGCMAVSFVRGAFPLSGEHYDISKAHQGNIFAILSGVQALVALVLIRFRFWAYRPLPLLLFGVAGAGGMLLFAAAHSGVAFGLAAALFGAYAGSFYFYLVFHSLVHPDRSARYVSINEAVVGLMGMVGPIVGGSIIQHGGLRGAYLATGASVLLMTLLQALIHQLQPIRSATSLPAVPEHSSVAST